MPGVNHPPSEFLLQLIGELQKQVRAISTQQQLVFSNAVGEIIAATGLLPGAAANYGLAAYDGASGRAVFATWDAPIPDGSGRRQTVTELWRDDGTTALALADLGTTPGHAHQQALQWFDRAGNDVVSDDTVGGVGLARPHIPAFAPQNTNTATWPSTNTAALTEIAASYIEYQQPKLSWQIQCYAPAGVTGKFELQIGGTTIGTTTVVGGASGTFYLWGDTQPMPSGLSFGSLYSVGLEAQVTAGSGTICAQPFFLQGQGT